MAVGGAARHVTRAHGWLWLAPGAAVAVGLYLLGWAARWPHSDLRNAGATLTGIGVLAVGLAVAGLLAAGVVTTAPRRLLTLVTAALAAALGAFVLAAVSADQRAACGTDLAACATLLPGF